MEREAASRCPISVGTMIELPRAALLAGEIAESAEFFSFGTNDLTQTTYGLSRDDAASFIGAYQKLGIFEQDPFVTLDTTGVGELIRIAVERGRATRPGSEARHLRRAWRRPGLDPVLPRGRARLRVVLALSGADRPARGGAGGTGEGRSRVDGLTRPSPVSGLRPEPPSPAMRERGFPQPDQIPLLHRGRRRGWPSRSDGRMRVTPAVASSRVSTARPPPR